MRKVKADAYWERSWKLFKLVLQGANVISINMGVSNDMDKITRTKICGGMENILNIWKINRQ